MDNLDPIAPILPIFDHVEMGFTILDAELDLVWSNTYFREHVGSSLSGVCGRHCFAGLDPDTPRCEDCLPPQIQRTRQVAETVRTGLGPDGSLQYFRVIVFPLMDEPDLIGTLMVPLAREDMEGESSWRERFLLSAIRNSEDAVFAVDRAGTVRFWNRGAERIFGWKVAEMVGQPVVDKLGGSDLTRESAELARGVLTPDDPLAPLEGRELRLATRDRGPIWVEVSRTPLLDGSGNPNGESFVMRDASERRRAAEKMAFTERMTAVGNMAAALAHEIGTPLGVISGNAEYLMLDLDDDDPRREDLEAIVREAERISGLVRDLLRFSRPEPPEMERIDLREVLSRVARLIHHASEKQRTEVRIDSPPQLPLVRGDINQLEQVVLNLTLNALQAVESGGTVVLGVSVDGDAGAGDASKPGLCLYVEDDGPGIPESLRPRVFEPFFTTKSNGTGLGLAVCQRVVQEHRGALVYREGTGGGARFEVRLPLTGAQDEPGGEQEANRDRRASSR